MKDTPAWLLAFGLLFSGVLAGCEHAASSTGEEQQAINSGSLPRSNASAASTSPRPRAVIEEAVYQFGSMGLGEERTHVFQIRNVGDAPLRIGEISTTCRCTVGQLRQNEIPPGGTADIELKWKAEYASESFRQEAEIQTNDPAHLALVVAVEGVVSPPLVLRPAKVWRVPELNDATPSEFTGTIHTNFADRFEILSMQGSSPSITARATPLTAEQLKELGAKAGYAVHVSVAPGAPVGEFQETLSIVTDLAEEPEISVAIAGTRPGPLAFHGARWNSVGNYLHLGTFARGDGRKETVSLVLRGGPEDPRIEVVEVDPPQAKVTVKRDRSFAGSDGGTRFLITVEFPANIPPMSRQLNDLGRVRLRTNHPELPEIQFGLRFQAI